MACVLVLLLRLIVVGPKGLKVRVSLPLGSSLYRLLIAVNSLIAVGSPVTRNDRSPGDSLCSRTQVAELPRMPCISILWTEFPEILVLPRVLGAGSLVVSGLLLVGPSPSDY